MSLTYERANKLLVYNPESGSLQWRVPKGTVRAGSLVIGRHRQGYIEAQIDGRKYLAHRLAWLLTYGCLPDIIDHVDGNVSNNKLVNLRAATHAENNQNSSIRKNNRLGLKGVSKVSNANRFQAEIQVDGKTIYLGCFKTPEAAHKAYREAAMTLHKDFANTGERRAAD